jgi:hypothetical protein
MVNAISAPLRLTAGNSIVLYQNILPERYSITLPSIGVVAEKKSEPIFENQRGNEVLYYDHQGHLKRQFRKGLFINAFFYHMPSFNDYEEELRKLIFNLQVS